MGGSKRAVKEGRQTPSTSIVLHEDPHNREAGSLSKKEQKDQDDREMSEMIDMLGLRKPKHVGHGLASGVGLLAGGIVGGAAALVACPVYGAKEGGAKGFAKGLGQGALAAVGLPVGGAVAGLTQLTRGAVQTPKAIWNSSRGKTWSRKTRSWITYSLPEEMAQLQEEEKEMQAHAEAKRRARAAERKARAVERRAAKLREKEEAERHAKEAGDAEDSSVASGKRCNGAPATDAKRKSGTKSASKTDGSKHSESDSDEEADTAFYDLLQVSPDASSSEIKRSYLRLARKMHPDKNPDDPLAKVKFQQLGEAYQVLSNEDTRARYDESGKKGVEEGMNFMDASTFYTVIFGSEGFEAFVGELQLSTLFSAAEEDEVSLRLMGHKQRMREAQCATELARLLEAYVRGDAEGFAADVKTRASELATTAFGELLVHTIGRVYSSKATLYLQKKDVRHLGGAAEAMRARGHSISTHVSAATSIVKMYREGKKMAGKAADGEEPQMDARSMATMMEAAWRLCVVDVEGTLRKVCKKVLSDNAVPPEERLRRAEGLRQLGAVFLAATSPENAQDGPKKTFRQQLEGFVQTMMPTASGDAEAEAAAAEAAAEKGGLLGRRVLIHGLQAKPELNGRAGVAVQFDGEKSRYSVMLLDDSNSQFVSIKPSNLKIDQAHVHTTATAEYDDDDSPLPPRAAEAGGSAGPSDAHPSAEELEAMPVRELRAMAEAASLDVSACIEKHDYVELLSGDMFRGSHGE